MSILLENKKCAAEATHEKHIAQTVAKQITQITVTQVCENRACAFTKVKDNILTFTKNY